MLERDIPELCADRVDYALREFKNWANPGIVNLCVANLLNRNGKIIFASKEAADAFGKTFMKCQTTSWGSAESALRYHLFSQALKIALQEEIISMDNLYSHDDLVMEKLKRSSN